MTDGGAGEISSAWYATPVNVQNFTQDFSFQLTNATGDGFTFVIQNSGVTAIGPPGAGLGYGAVSPGGKAGIPTSVAVKFDLYNNFGEGIDSTGLYTDGASPTIPAIDMTSSGVSLHSGDIMNVHMTYNGATLSMTITDTVTNAVFTKSWPIDIPGTVGAPTAYVGFTASSGAATAVQDILDWTYVAPYTISYLQGFSTTGLAMNGDAALNGTRLRLTDGGDERVLQRVVRHAGEHHELQYRVLLPADAGECRRNDICDSERRSRGRSGRRAQGLVTARPAPVGRVESPTASRSSSICITT